MISLATIGVCVFGAFASVGALFYFAEIIKVCIAFHGAVFNTIPQDKMDGDKMNFKKFLASLLPVFLIFVFTACGCKHEWSEATCLSPKICNLCGVTEGKPIEHSYMDANCDNPKRCSFCDATEGKALGHDYVNGYCTKCYIKDPNYIDLNNFGFTNMYGMNEWLEISGYNFSQNRVTVSNDFDFIIYYDKYWYSGEISEELISTVTDVSSDLFDSIKTESYTLLSNDVIQYYGGDGLGPVTIFDRVVSSDNSKIVLKTLDEAKSGSYREYWYVPAGLLDFSTVTKEENNNTYYIYFK